MLRPRQEILRRRFHAPSNSGREGRARRKGRFHLAILSRLVIFVAMNRPSDHTARDFTVSLPAADYIARFRDAERIAAYCRACPNYGRSWACPPFGFDMDDYLAGYRTALIIATKITPAQTGLPLSEAASLLRPERVRLEHRLLELERRYAGRAFAYAGTCLYCPAEGCSRPEGAPCRHPEWVRPSLEACGFDLCRTTEELFGIPLRWSSDGRLPEYLTLVSGFFHNAELIDWEE